MIEKKLERVFTLGKNLKKVVCLAAGVGAGVALYKIVKYHLDYTGDVDSNDKEKQSDLPKYATVTVKKSSEDKEIKVPKNKETQVKVAKDEQVKVKITENKDMEIEISKKIEQLSKKVEQGRNMIIYFTWSGESRRIAEHIYKKVGQAIFEIVPIKAYPKNYEECVRTAFKEKYSKNYPPVYDLPDSIKYFDRVFICYPIWWDSLPPSIISFLKKCDFAGKDVIPISHSASMDEEAFKNSTKGIKENAINANVLDGLYIRPNDMVTLDNYLKGLGLVNE